MGKSPEKEAKLGSNQSMASEEGRPRTGSKDSEKENRPDNLTVKSVSQSTLKTISQDKNTSIGDIASNARSKQSSNKKVVNQAKPSITSKNIQKSNADKPKPPRSSGGVRRSELRAAVKSNSNVISEKKIEDKVVLNGDLDRVDEKVSKSETKSDKRMDDTKPVEQPQTDTKEENEVDSSALDDVSYSSLFVFFNPFQNWPVFLCVHSTSLLKTL